MSLFFSLHWTYSTLFPKLATISREKKVRCTQMWSSLKNETFHAKVKKKKIENDILDEYNDCNRRFEPL